MNTAAQHTPGPWGYDRPTGEVYHADGDVMPRIATVDLDNVAADQFDADLYLIAAAPELLAALEYLLEQTIEQDEQYGCLQTEGEIDAAQMARAAIAKAKGGAA